MIIYVEDDESIRTLVLYALKQAGLEACGLPDGKELVALCEREPPELVLLDVMLPGEDGFALLRRLKEHPATRAIQVLMITARGAEYDRVQGLDMGAEDYIVKPFGMMELLSRVRAALRRNAPRAEDATLTRGPIRMDLTRREVTAGGEPVTLTFKEFELLRCLMAHPGRVFTREQLLEDVWGYDYAGGTRTVDVHVQTLRQKLGAGGACVETVRGVGYRMGGEEA